MGMTLVTAVKSVTLAAAVVDVASAVQCLNAVTVQVMALCFMIAMFMWTV